MDGTGAVVADPDVVDEDIGAVVEEAVAVVEDTETVGGGLLIGVRLSDFRSVDCAIM